MNELEELKENAESTPEEIRASLERFNQVQMDAFSNAYKNRSGSSEGSGNDSQ